MAGAHITEFWVKSGKEPQFGQLVEDMVAFLGELEYPYPVVGYRVHFGDSGRMVFVTWFDDRASYYGENNLQKLIGEKNAFERWSQLRGRLPELVLDIREHDAIFRPRMSYWPEVEASSR